MKNNISQTEFDAKVAVVTETDWARLSAWIDTRWGSIVTSETAARKGTKPQPILALTIVHADPRIICWLKDTFGGSTAENKKILSWSIYGDCAAEVIRRVMPTLIVKQGRAEHALAWHELHKK